MKKEHFYVIGVMSGTSLDGLDLALVEFNLIKGKWAYRYVSATTTPYPDSWQKARLEGQQCSGFSLS